MRARLRAVAHAWVCGALQLVVGSSTLAVGVREPVVVLTLRLRDASGEDREQVVELSKPQLEELLSSCGEAAKVGAREGGAPAALTRVPLHPCSGCGGWSKREGRRVLWVGGSCT